MKRKEIFIRCVVCGGTKSQEEMTRKNSHEWKCNEGICKKCTKQHREDVKIVSPNKVYCGDNLEIMKKICDESVDLIYLDPPYFTQTNWKVGNNEFSDYWKDMNEYLKYMEIRLQEMYRVLKDTGSIYLHVDHHAVYELKLIMDDIFGRNNFKNDIIWTYSGPSNPNIKYFPRKHDNILFYTKGKKYTFNNPRTSYKGKLSVGGNTSWAKDKKDVSKYIETGKFIEDWWTDITALQRNENEKVGYPTQKPIELLKRIIKASSNENDIVFDPFCGSGTTLIAASELGRKYIGIDQNKQAVKIAKKRTVETRFNEW